jgi:hypothetical protein
MTFDLKNETIGHLYGTSIFRCNFFFLQSIPKKFQLYNEDQKRILRMIFFCLYVDNSTCYVKFNSTMRRHWMTFLVEKCNIGHFCITDIFLCSFPISCENQKSCDIMIYDKKRRISVISFIFSLSDTVFFIRVNFDT